MGSIRECDNLGGAGSPSLQSRHDTTSPIHTRSMLQKSHGEYAEPVSAALCKRPPRDSGQPIGSHGFHEVVTIHYPI